jgi:hypothetical protein
MAADQIKAENEDLHDELEVTGCEDPADSIEVPALSGEVC